ncbi:MAG: ferrous iron transport protein B [Myxococcota bacterium]|nr:ferrous iron transport protein B [Myxococcota bacterium]
MTTAESKDRVRVAFVGNPNTGKTSIYNSLTGARGKVANYPGITVERRSATIQRKGRTYDIVDLPGCYSLVARSVDEKITHDELSGHTASRPDVIIAVVSATQLARQLYLTLQLLELQRPLIVALNMMDLAEKDGVEVDVDALSQALGVRVIPVVAVDGSGLERLFVAADQALTGHPLLALAPNDAKAVAGVQTALRAAAKPASVGDALWLMTSVDSADAKEAELCRDALDAAQRLTAIHPDPMRPSDLKRRIIAARYKEIDRILANAVTSKVSSRGPDESKIDAVLTHPVWGLLCFAIAMLVLFQAVFTWSDPLIGWVEAGVSAVAVSVTKVLPSGLVQSMIVDGLIPGIGNVLVFLPQIIILFLAISLLEDSGYMARVAFILDRLMRSVGLSGQSFVPLMSSFACAIPGVMAARTIPTHRDRMVTIAIAPLMSCSARLPVYTLVIGAVFSTSEPVLGILSVPGLIITGMYFTGIAAAFFVAKVLKGLTLQGSAPPLLLEFPRYRRPRVRDVARVLADRCWIFITQTGRVIIVLSILLWGAMTWPNSPLSSSEKASIEQHALTKGTDVDIALARAEEKHRLINSAAGQAGLFIEPIIEPLGFDWKLGIGLIGSFAAREVLVSTLGQVYGTGSSSDEESPLLRQAMLSDIDPATGKPRFTPLVGLSLMVFFAIAMQCLSTFAVVRKETNSWTWPLTMLLGYNALAWLASFATYQIGTALGWG